MDGPVLTFLRYLFDDFFRKIHQTGLYNRQRELFESIGKAENGEVAQVDYGMFFNKTTWPCHDVTLTDNSGNPLIVARIVDVSEGHADKSNAMDWLRHFTDKLNKLQARKGTLGGGFFVYTGDFPDDLKSKVESLVKTSDPAGKYDCRLPAPAMVPLNLLEIEKFDNPHLSADATADDTCPPFAYKAKLVLPQLKN